MVAVDIKSTSLRARGRIEDVLFMTRAHPAGAKEEAPGVAWMPSASGWVVMVKGRSMIRTSGLL